MFLDNEMVKYDLPFNPRTLAIIRLVVEYLARPTFPLRDRPQNEKSLPYWISVTGVVFFADFTIG